MKFVFFSVSENGENVLGYQVADGGNAPIIFGLEPPLLLKSVDRMRCRLAARTLVWCALVPSIRR